MPSGPMSPPHKRGQKETLAVPGFSKQTEEVQQKAAADILANSFVAPRKTGLHSPIGVSLRRPAAGADRPTAPWVTSPALNYPAMCSAATSIYRLMLLTTMQHSTGM